MSNLTKSSKAPKHLGKHYWAVLRGCTGSEKRGSSRGRGMAVRCVRLPLNDIGLR